MSQQILKMEKNVGPILKSFLHFRPNLGNLSLMMLQKENLTVIVLDTTNIYWMRVTIEKADA